MRQLSLRLLILIAQIVFLCSCGTTSLTQHSANEEKPIHPSTIERIVERGTILIGTTGDYRPLSFREADGTYWGFDIEVAGEIAKRLGVGIQFVPTSWPTLTADVLAEPQTFDLAIGGITITDARRKTMLMSEGYLANGKTILCRASEADRYQSQADIDRPEVRVLSPAQIAFLRQGASRSNAPSVTLHRKMCHYSCIGVSRPDAD